MTRAFRPILSEPFQTPFTQAESEFREAAVQSGIMGASAALLTITEAETLTDLGAASLELLSEWREV